MPRIQEFIGPPHQYMIPVLPPSDKQPTDLRLRSQFCSLVTHCKAEEQTFAPALINLIVIQGLYLSWYNKVIDRFCMDVQEAL